MYRIKIVQIIKITLDHINYKFHLKSNFKSKHKHIHKF